MVGAKEEGERIKDEDELGACYDGRGCEDEWM